MKFERSAAILFRVFFLMNDACSENHDSSNRTTCKWHAAAVQPE